MSEDSGGARPGFARRQLSDEVASYVRELIMSGRLRPGDFIRQERIADELELSATPVREGLWRRRRPGTSHSSTSSPACADSPTISSRNSEDDLRPLTGDVNWGRLR
jgi:DNA-binding FadR family transcriptional regulator